MTVGPILAKSILRSPWKKFLGLFLVFGIGARIDLVNIQGYNREIEHASEALFAPLATAFWDDSREKLQGLEGYDYSSDLENDQPTITNDTGAKKVVMGDTLALVDARLLGGFRNQHMRLVALAVHATKKKIPNLLVESLRWDNPVARRIDPAEGRVPFDVLFDVDHWNSVSDQVGTDVLPRLVYYNPEQHPDWDPEIGLFRRVNASIALSHTGIRGYDLLSSVTGCQKPYAHGSGRPKSGGRLWNEYAQYKKEGYSKSNRTLASIPATERAMMQALQPSKLLAQVVANISSSPIEAVNTGMIAIHPRVEIEMLIHRCSKKMTKNLTKIIEYVEQSPYFRQNTDIPFHHAFLCVSQDGIANVTKDFDRVRKLGEQNWAAFERASAEGLWNGSVPFVEGGETMVATLPELKLNQIETAAMVVNFFVAVRAKAFVGTYGSSYSTDIWTVRYVLANTKQSDSSGIQIISNINHLGLKS